MKLPEHWTPMDEDAAREILARQLPNPTTLGVSGAIARIEADMVLKGHNAYDIRTAIETNFPSPRSQDRPT
jgi:hypothetical protein